MNHLTMKMILFRQNANIYTTKIVKQRFASELTHNENKQMSCYWCRYKYYPACSMPSMKTHEHQNSCQRKKKNEEKAIEEKHREIGVEEWTVDKVILVYLPFLKCISDCIKDDT